MGKAGYALRKRFIELGGVELSGYEVELRGNWAVAIFQLGGYTAHIENDLGYSVEYLEDECGYTEEVYTDNVYIVRIRDVLADVDDEDVDADFSIVGYDESQDVALTRLMQHSNLNNL